MMGIFTWQANETARPREHPGGDWVNGAILFIGAGFAMNNEDRERIPCSLYQISRARTGVRYPAVLSLVFCHR